MYIVLYMYNFVEDEEKLKERAMYIYTYMHIYVQHRYY